jgi:hypothetical protein
MLLTVVESGGDGEVVIIVGYVAGYVCMHTNGVVGPLPLVRVTYNNLCNFKLEKPIEYINTPFKNTGQKHTCRT